MVARTGQYQPIWSASVDRMRAPRQTVPYWFSYAIYIALPGHAPDTNPRREEAMSNIWRGTTYKSVLLKVFRRCGRGLHGYDYITFRNGSSHFSKDKHTNGSLKLNSNCPLRAPARCSFSRHTWAGWHAPTISGSRIDPRRRAWRVSQQSEPRAAVCAHYGIMHNTAIGSGRVEEGCRV